MEISFLNFAFNVGIWFRYDQFGSNSSWPFLESPWWFDALKSVPVSDFLPQNDPFPPKLPFFKHFVNGQNVSFDQFGLCIVISLGISQLTSSVSMFTGRTRKYRKQLLYWNAEASICNLLSKSTTACPRISGWPAGYNSLIAETLELLQHPRINIETERF